MKKIQRFLLLPLLLAIALSLVGFSLGAEQARDDGERAAEDALLHISSSFGASDMQAWINGYLTENAGVGAEWYILALSQYESYDFSSYEEALLAYLRENTVNSPSSRLKYALCLASVGSTDGYITRTLQDSIGEQGLISLVFGLHLLNNGYQSEAYTSSSLISEIIRLQLDDGGFAVAGDDADVDATAMTVQALSPYYATDSDVSAALDKALLFLSECQLDDGGYMSYGLANPESTSQVLIALSSLGIRAEEDERFVKNGSDLVAAIEKYRLEGGGYCHSEGGQKNNAATSQVFCAMVSYLRVCREESSLYLLDHADPDGVLEDDNSDGITDSVQDASVRWTPGYKLWATLIIVGVGIVSCALLLVLKKRHFKNFLFVLVVCALAIAVICLTNFHSADDYYSGSGASKENVKGSVTMTIRCDAVAGRAPHIPENGIILALTEFEIGEGDSVYTILLDAARSHRIQLENDGSEASAYISGIAYLYACDYGALSGWEYRVNGVRPPLGASEYRLEDGDLVEWYYTTTIGKEAE